MIPLIVVVRKTGLVSVNDVARACEAIQKQISCEFAEAYRVDATFGLLSDGEPVPAEGWPIELRDAAPPEDGALGEHMDDLKPSGLVGVQTCLDDAVPWTSCLSHEALELAADPWASLVSQRGATLYAFEVCDPVEGAGYQIDGVDVENFVLPAWFLGGPGPYDHLGVLKAPGSLAPGGYMQTMPAGGWSQSNAEKVRASKLLTLPGSRRAKRSAAL